MAITQTKEDKDRFFTDLEQLGHSDSEEEQLLPSVLTKSSECSRQPRLPQDCGTDDQDIVYTYTRGVDRRPSRPSVVEQMTASKGTSLREVIDLTSPKHSEKSIEPKDRFLDSTAGSGTKRKHPNTVTDQPRKKAKKSKNEVQLLPEDKQLFRGMTFFFVPNDDIPKVRKLRILRATEHGAYCAKQFDDSVTHVVVEHQISYTEAAKAFPNRVIPDGTLLVKTTWLSECLAKESLRDVHQSRFRLLNAPSTASLLKTPSPKKPSSNRSSNGKSPLKTKSPAKTYLSTTPGKNYEEEQTENFEKIVSVVKNAGSNLSDADIDNAEGCASFDQERELFDAPPKRIRSDEATPDWTESFQCMHPGGNTEDDNPNAKTITVLQGMATYYDRTGDKWRTTAYRKAIGALRKQSKLIATREQALAIPQIGTRLADKVEEIVTTNHLRRLDNTNDDPHDKTLQLFMGIYDVGHKQAMQWIAQGHRTLDDLKEKATLSPNQRVGLAHYDDFLERIPRAEVSQHAAIVIKACKAIDKDLQVIVGGSYRRGNVDSGDIDLIITKPNSTLHHINHTMTINVIPALTKANFLKCSLASSSSSSGGSNWHGASCLPYSRTWRRIDLLFVPSNEIGAALIYFTGNDIFNRSMRLLARKKGMRLNQRGLYKDVMRGEGGQRTTDGTLLESQSEKRIFEILGVPWSEAHERNC